MDIIITFLLIVALFASYGIKLGDLESRITELEDKK